MFANLAGVVPAVVVGGVALAGGVTLVIVAAATGFMLPKHAATASPATVVMQSPFMRPSSTTPTSAGTSQVPQTSSSATTSEAAPLPMVQPATVTSAQPSSLHATMAPAPSVSELTQAQVDRNRILASTSWQPISSSFSTDWVGVKCSSQPPDTAPNAAVGGNLTLTIWNPSPDSQQVEIDAVTFSDGSYSPITVFNQTVPANAVETISTTYTSLLGNWSSGCRIAN
jgi:hypothetical protein